MRRPAWLGRELDAWQGDGLITHDQHRAILARYESPPTAAHLVSRTLVWLALLSAGVGLTVLVIRNWAALPAWLALSVSLGATTASYAAAIILGRRGAARPAERAAVLGALLAGGALLLGADAFHADADATDIPLLWALVLASTAALVPSTVAAGVASAVLFWWMLVTGGSRVVPWGFLLAWPMLALAVERAQNRLAASGVALIFGIWVFFAALAVWGNRGADAAPFVIALLAGAWLDALAHSANAERPAFARAAPALTVTVLALAFLLPSGSHGLAMGWWTGSTDAWAMLVLVGALAAATLRAGLGQTGRRPLVLTAVCLAWVTTWLAAPAALAGTTAQWCWTLVFSGVAVFVGSSAIGEFSATHDRGVFGAGIAAILLVIVVRGIDASHRGGVTQAAVLIAAGGLLYWLGRAAARGPLGTAT